MSDDLSTLTKQWLEALDAVKHHQALKAAAEEKIAQLAADLTTAVVINGVKIHPSATNGKYDYAAGVALFRALFPDLVDASVSAHTVQVTDWHAVAEETKMPKQMAPYTPGAKCIKITDARKK